MRRHGVEVFESTVALIEALRARGRKIACVSSSNNCRPVLERAKLTGLFDAIVDGNDLEREQLAGKPAPDTLSPRRRAAGGETGGGGGDRGCGRRGRRRQGWALRTGDRDRPGRRPSGAAAQPAPTSRSATWASSRLPEVWTTGRSEIGRAARKRLNPPPEAFQTTPGRGTPWPPAGVPAAGRDRVCAGQRLSGPARSRKITRCTSPAPSSNGFYETGRSSTASRPAVF